MLFRGRWTSGVASRHDVEKYSCPEAGGLYSFCVGISAHRSTNVWLKPKSNLRASSSSRPAQRCFRVGGSGNFLFWGCVRRGKLYYFNGFLGCRHCAEATYESHRKPRASGRVWETMAVPASTYCHLSHAAGGIKYSTVSERRRK